MPSLLEEVREVAPPTGPPDADDDGDGRDDDGGERIEWVTVAHYGDAGLAHVARLRVEADGIPCFIADENVAVTAWHYALATGGIKLQVPRGDVERAEASLRYCESPRVLMITDPNCCPRCGSSSTCVERWSSRRTVGLIMLALMAMSAHPLIGLMVFVAGVAYISTTGRLMCAECDLRLGEPTPRGFEVVATPEPEKR